MFRRTLPERASRRLLDRLQSPGQDDRHDPQTQQIMGTGRDWPIKSPSRLLPWKTFRLRITVAKPLPINITLISGSSEETVGGFRLGQPAKCGRGPVPALGRCESRRIFSFSGPKVIENQFPVLAKRASDLHGFDAGAHGLPAPFVEELTGPSGRVIIPELLKCFLR
jgi:hypothetical protein